MLLLLLVLVVIQYVATSADNIIFRVVYLYISAREIQDNFVDAYKIDYLVQLYTHTHIHICTVEI